MDERRVVTVLFCDVANSTALAGQLDDPEDWAEIISEAFPCLIEPVERYGGTVSRLLGDAILAFFGAPTAHEDDAQRAILAGLDIIEEIGPLREKLRREHNLDFNVRIGINTGTVIVGEFGTQSASEYTAMGDVVNVAARMEQTAQPGTVQVTVNTYRLAAQDFTFEPLGGITVKGKTEPVDAYRVTGRAPDRSRRRNDFASWAFIGRERELRALHEALAQARSEQLRIVAVAGEAGLGKTRLLEEFRESALLDGDRGQQPVWIEDHFSPFEASIPYSLFRRRIAHGLQVDDGDPLGTIRERLGEKLDSDDRDSMEREAHAIEMLFRQSPDWAGTGEPGLGLVPFEEFRRVLVQTLERLLRREVARSGAGVYVIDDLHFVDPASLDLLGDLIPRLAGLEMLVLLALRPDTRNPAWALHQRLAADFPGRYQTLTLAPLEDWQAGALVDELTRGASLSPDFRRSVLDRIDGNPLFAEEIVKLLIDQRLIERDLQGEGRIWRVASDVDLDRVTIPNTLQVLIQDRMDRLDDDVRDTLQLASVFGRSFSHGEIAAVIDDPAGLDRHLEEIERSMFIRSTPGDRGREYSFNHSLTRDAVYQTILRRRRPELHLRVGEALEALYHGMEDERAGLLSVHFAEAMDPRAVQFAVAAGDRALALYAPSEAVEHYSRAIETARRLNVNLPAGVIRRRGQAHETLGQFDRARDDVEAALVRARQAGNLRETWQAHMQIGLLWAGRDYTRSAEHYERALEIARELNDPLLVAHSLNREGNLKVNMGEPLEARTLHSEALEIFRKAHDPAGMAETYDLLGMASFHSYDLIALAENYERAVALHRDIDNRFGLAAGLSLLAARGGELDIDDLDLDVQDIERGQRAGEEAVAIARETG